MAESLLTKLRAMKYNPSDVRWVQFIQDHKNYLTSKSEVIVISKNIMNLYKYRPMDFLNYLKVQYDLCWIILYINNILDPMNFINKNFIYKPTTKTITDLKTKYNTYLKKAAS